MSPVQYCGFGDPATLLQKALHRAMRIAHPSQIAVTVREENRARWESSFWFLRAEHRFVSDQRITSALTTAAALLSIAADSPSNVVTILPTRCYVGDERILSSALERLHAMLPGVAEGVATLGMVDIDDGVDEDYLVPREGNEGPGVAIVGMARRPVGWVAQHLRQSGAMVASGILTGYAGVFAKHIHKHWPALAKTLCDLIAATPGGEKRLRAHMGGEVARSVLPALRWSAPIFPQRALPVIGCGWRGLHTARAVSRISASCVVTIDSVPQFVPNARYQPVQTSPFRMARISPKESMVGELSQALSTV
jgi:hypothetical protein